MSHWIVELRLCHKKQNRLVDQGEDAEGFRNFRKGPGERSREVARLAHRIWSTQETYPDRPGRRIVDDDRLQRLLQPSEIVVKKSFRWLYLKKTSEIVVNDG